jgi:ClpP class serine protease
MERKTVQETIDKIKSDKNIYTTSSQKDEVSVMRAMLNDDTYHIDLYNNKGCDRLYNMALETKDMISKVVSSQCNISLDQAKRMVNGYEFDNEDAKTMISASKNFVTTYLLLLFNFEFFCIFMF